MVTESGDEWSTAAIDPKPGWWAWTVTMLAPGQLPGPHFLVLRCEIRSAAAATMAAVPAPTMEPIATSPG